MIIDIPDKRDLEQAGLAMLNLAWDAITALYRNLEEVKISEWDEDGQVADEYWRAAQRSISVALGLTVQGMELLLKARIIEVSPFLLIAGSPREWPSRCVEIDTSYADFRTIDSHDLIRVHNTVVQDRLSESFKNKFDQLRRLRNVIFHSVDKKARFTADKVFRAILEAVKNLQPKESWISIRRYYLENNPESVAFSTDHVELLLVTEILSLLKILKPSEAKTLIGFDKRQRHYICYTCAMNSGDNELRPKFAILDPNKPNSTQLYCIVCEKNYAIVRRKCKNRECPGNVVDAEDGRCLTCFE